MRKQKANHSDLENPGQGNDKRNVLLDVVEELVRELHSGYGRDLAVTLDSSLDRDLGLDSLSRVELLARLEKAFGVALSEKVLFSAETPRDLLRAVISAGGESLSIVKEVSHVRPGSQTGVPVHAETLHEVLHWYAERNPDHPHIRLYSDTDDGEVITYGDLLRGASRLAAGLQQAGLAAGEAVLIMLPTGRDYFFSFFGILLAGGVPVPLYPPGRIKQLEEHLLRHSAIAANSRAAIMIVMPEALQFANLMKHGVGTLKKFLTVDDLTIATDIEELIEPAVSTNDTAFLQYTSGSTGMPKGVILSHANLLANIRAMGKALGVSDEDVFVSWLPLYHDMGLIGAWLGSLYYACPLIIMSPLSFISRPVRWLRAIHRYGGTLSAAPNFAYELCVRRIEEKDLEGIDLGSWRCAFNGAEAVSPVIIRKFIEKFAGYGFRAETMMPVYGLAESSVGLAFPPQDRGPLINRVSRKDLMERGQAVTVDDEYVDGLEVVSCGVPLPGHQIRVVDNRGSELPDRRVGRVQFVGPSTTSGYFMNPEESAKLFQDIWLDSGDKGYVASGELYVTGRNKDIIIRGGRNIYPVELEEAVGNIEGVRAGNVAVFGSVDKKDATERLIILAETRIRKPERLSELRTLINSAVSDLVGIPPDDIVLAPPNTVLKTSSGKIRRSSSRELYENGLIGKTAKPVWFQVGNFYGRGIITKVSSLIRGFGDFCYALWCWLVFILAAPVTWVTLMILPGEAMRSGFSRIISRCVAKTVGIKVRVNGEENLRRSSRPIVIVSNHASYLDAIMVSGFLPEKVSFVAKSELKDNIFLRLALSRLGVIFVERFDREKGVSDARTLVDRIGEGRSLYFFAEGTFSRMPGLLPFRMGAFETAVTRGAAVLPITIRGTRSILRAHSWFPRRGIVRVTIGEPIISGDQGDKWGRAVQLRDRTRRWILDHCSEPDLVREKSPLQV